MSTARPSPLELSSLIASRVCHDIISPVGAIGNGLEVLDDDDSGAMAEFAMDLIRKSAEQASIKLQFARLAFGASGASAGEIDMSEASACSIKLLARENTEIDWAVRVDALPKTEAKLLLNLLVLCANSIARGGSLKVRADRTDSSTVLQVTARGDRAALGGGVADALSSGEVPDPLDAHSVQPYFTALLAEEAGMTIEIEENEGRVVITAS